MWGARRTVSGHVTAVLPDPAPSALRGDGGHVDGVDPRSRDRSTVRQDGQCVAQRENLIEPVGYVHEGDAPTARSPDAGV